MTDLSLAPAPERSPLRAVVLSVVVLSVVAAAVFLLNPRKTAELAITKMAFFAPHTETKDIPGQMHVIGEAPSAEDDLYVVTTVRMTDKIRLPLFISGTTATMTLADGSSLDARVISQRSLQQLELTFPALEPMAGKLFNTDDPIAPSEAREGNVILLFPGINQAAWHTKKSAVITFDLAHQSPQTIALP
jgi:hypothetical protein